MNLMAIEDISQIKGLISSSHGGDVNQLEAIFSKEKRILLEAPAGCGKTKTMVSKAAYIIATGELGKNKKILALTFSVNAAYRMKKDLSDRLPMMGISGLNTPADMNHFITITNYHGLARRILARYGYLLNPELKNINFFKAYDEKTICEGIFTELNLSPEYVVVLDGFSKSINSADVHGLEKNINSYNEILLRNLIPNKLITYNGYITICMYLLASYPRLLKFYNLLYPFVMIDEFQDTNLLCWRFVQQFVLSKTDLFFMGDPLQRIYGFIGAVPGLCDLACSKYSMGKIVLTQNYRFRDNPSMLNLDSNIRAVAKQLTDYEYYNEYSRSIDIGNATTADINFSRYDNPAQEATSLTKKITSILQESNVRVALLIQSRNQNIDLIMKSLEQNRIDFFYGLFTDDNPTYVAFHNKAQSIFFDTLQSSRSKHVGKNVFSATINKLKDYYSNSNDSLYRTDEDNKIITSLLILVEAFFRKLIQEYAFLEDGERIDFIKDTFENRALKQNMDYVESHVIISTVHAAKGLEWEYVFIPNMDRTIFPNWPSLCRCCDYRTSMSSSDFCNLFITRENQDTFLEELSVFYVAVTRAKKTVLFSGSKKYLNKSGELKNGKYSCLLNLPGIKA